MKKGFLLSFLHAALILVGINMVGCNNKTTEVTTNEPSDSIVEEEETTYFTAIDRYLVNEIGKNYAEGEYCVPFHSIVGIDERNAEDILVWGDYWVFNYNLEGDTLKTVSGGSHPGLMHVRQIEDGFEVRALTQWATAPLSCPPPRGFLATSMITSKPSMAMNRNASS